MTLNKENIVLEDGLDNQNSKNTRNFQHFFKKLTSFTTRLTLINLQKMLDTS